MEFDSATEKAVRETAIDFRNRHGALSFDAKVDDLLDLGGLSQDEFRIGGLGYGRSLSTVHEKVRAILSVRDNAVLISSDLPQTKRPFAKAHELGHSELEWHREIFYHCDEHDLSPSTRSKLEWEANTFAAEVLLPKPLLDNVFSQCDMTMDTVIWLKSIAGTSIACTAIQLVKHAPDVLALLTLQLRRGEGESTLVLERKSLSRAAVATPLASIEPGQVLPTNHVAMAAVASSQKKVVSHEIVVGSSGAADARFRATSLWTGYRVLTLVRR